MAKKECGKGHIYDTAIYGDECPFCSTQNNTGETVIGYSGKTVISGSAENTRECPYCAETIKKKATVCRFCGRDLPLETGLQTTVADGETQVGPGVKTVISGNNSGENINGKTQIGTGAKTVLYGHSPEPAPVASKPEVLREDIDETVIQAKTVITPTVNQETNPQAASNGKKTSASFVVAIVVWAIVVLIALIGVLYVNNRTDVGLSSPAPTPQPSPAPIPTPAPPSERPATVYKIGDRGPAGGIVFYDKGSYSDGWRYLESAPARLRYESGIDMNAIWGLSGLFGTSNAIGSGRRNTQIIVDALPQDWRSISAAQLCIEYTGGGKNDWFLPSRDELYLMHKNLGLEYGSVSWSSSENTSSHAWFQPFNGDPEEYYKDGMLGVHAVRAF